MLVVGREGTPPAPAAPAEVFRPSTRTWEQVGSLSLGRTASATAALGDGRVLVTGGINDDRGEVTGSTEVYDDDTGDVVGTGAPLVDGTLPARRHHAAGRRGCSSPAAGASSATRGTEPGQQRDLRPRHGEWSRAGDHWTCRASCHTATLLEDGTVLVVGGRDGTEQRLPPAGRETYDPVTGLWTTAGPLSTGRDGHTANLMGDGKVLVTGGYSDSGTLATSEVYDPDHPHLEPDGVTQRPRKWHAATALSDGRVLVAGGQNRATTEVYSPASKTWRSAGAAGRRSEYPSVTATSRNGTALVAGGYKPHRLPQDRRDRDPAAAPARSSTPTVTAVADRARTTVPRSPTSRRPTPTPTAPATSARPSTPGSVTLAGAHQKVSGVRRLVLSGKVSVADSMTGCRSGRDVVLARLDPATGQWTQVAAPSTASDGTYRAGPARPDRSLPRPGGRADDHPRGIHQHLLGDRTRASSTTTERRSAPATDAAGRPLR